MGTYSMTSEPSNIVHLRDSLPPLQQSDTMPPVAPTPAPRRRGLPLGVKVIFAMIAGVAGVGAAYLGYTGHWPNVDAASPGATVIEPDLPVEPPSPPQTSPAANLIDSPVRDVLYSINVDAPSILSPTIDERPARDAGTTSDVGVDSAPRAQAVLPTQPELHAPASPDALTPSSNGRASASNDISLAYRNQARIEAIEGYIVEMLTVIESQKTELRAIRASLEKNTSAIDQQMQRVAALMQQRETRRDVASPINATTAVESGAITLPFRVTSIRQFGEALSVRIEDKHGASRLMVPGQEMIGWQLIKVDPDRRHAEFVHLESRTHQEAGL